MTVLALGAQWAVARDQLPGLRTRGFVALLAGHFLVRCIERKTCPVVIQHNPVKASGIAVAAAAVRRPVATKLTRVWIVVTVGTATGEPATPVGSVVALHTGQVRVTAGQRKVCPRVVIKGLTQVSEPGLLVAAGTPCPPVDRALKPGAREVPAMDVVVTCRTRLRRISPRGLRDIETVAIGTRHLRMLPMERKLQPGVRRGVEVRGLEPMGVMTLETTPGADRWVVEDGRVRLSVTGRAIVRLPAGVAHFETQFGSMACRALQTCVGRIEREAARFMELPRARSVRQPKRGGVFCVTGHATLSGACGSEHLLHLREELGAMRSGVTRVAITLGGGACPLRLLDRSRISQGRLARLARLASLFRPSLLSCSVTDSARMTTVHAGQLQTEALVITTVHRHRCELLDTMAITTTVAVAKRQRATWYMGTLGMRILGMGILVARVAARDVAWHRLPRGRLLQIAAVVATTTRCGGVRTGKYHPVGGVLFDAELHAAKAAGVMAFTAGRCARQEDCGPRHRVRVLVALRTGSDRDMALCGTHREERRNRVTSRTLVTSGAGNIGMPPRERKRVVHKRRRIGERVRLVMALRAAVTVAAIVTVIVTAVALLLVAKEAGAALGDPRIVRSLMTLLARELRVGTGQQVVIVVDVVCRTRVARAPKRSLGDQG